MPETKTATRRATITPRATETRAGRSAPPLAYQTSTMSALLNGVYDGDTTVAELLQHGDAGIGTYNQLDGEMAVLDGVCYRMRADGTVSVVPPESRTPYATVTYFVPETSLPLQQAASRARIEALADQAIGTPNLVHAIRLNGTFPEVRTRTVSQQPRPYPPFVDATANDPIITHRNVTGTMIGFRSPAYVQGISVAGYHVHFVDDARERGGHVLDFTLDYGLLEISTGLSMFLDLPRTEAFQNADLTSREVHAEIIKTEGGGLPYGDGKAVGCVGAA